MPDRLLSVPEAAAYLGLSAVRVRQLCQEGRLGCRVGERSYAITESELRAFRRLKRPAGRPKASG